MPQADDQPSPPRAFTQGVGTVFQVVGVSLFILTMTICCLSSLLSKETAERPDLTRIGWRIRAGGEHFYSAQRAMSVSVAAGLALGLALASAGLGLQAMRRSAPPAAVLTALVGLGFWGVQAGFAAQVLRSIGFTAGASLLTLLFGLLTLLAMSAWREMRRDPPAADHEVLAPSYQVPYSHYHPDPPEVRLERELEARRRRLAAQQRELELLEDELRRKRNEAE